MQLLPGTATMTSRRAPSLVLGLASSALRLAVLLVVAGSASGCAATAGRLIASQDEYLAYRRVRVSTELAPRLAHSARYLECYPSGRWVTEVQPWFERAEYYYYLAHKHTPDGLKAYLDTLPNGPHADEARTELDDHRRQQRDERQVLLGIQAAAVEERLAQRHQERERASDAFVHWLGRLLQIDTWGERTSELNHNFLFAWRIDPPGARCTDDRCSRLVRQQYALPGGEQGRRELVMEVVLLLREGRLVRARLEGPELFSRLYEASTNKPVTPENPLARVLSIAHAVDVIQGAAEARMPASSCVQEVVAPIVVQRSCGGWSIRATVAEHPADDDVVEIEGPATASW